MSLLIRARVLIRLNGSRRDKTCLRSFRRCETQTSLLSYRDKQYDTLQKANNKGADQSVWMRRLVRTFVVDAQTPEDRFSRVEAQIWYRSPDKSV